MLFTSVSNTTTTHPEWVGGTTCDARSDNYVVNDGIEERQDNGRNGPRAEKGRCCYVNVMRPVQNLKGSWVVGVGMAHQQLYRS